MDSVCTYNVMDVMVELIAGETVIFEAYRETAERIERNGY